jgi:hypothetical protein
MLVIGITLAARCFALEGEKSEIQNAHVIPQSNSESGSETWSWKPVQSVQNLSNALVVTSNTLQNVGCMLWSSKGGNKNNNQLPRQQ